LTSKIGETPIICMTAPNNNDSLLNYCRHRSCCGGLHSPNEDEPWRLQIACAVRALKGVRSKVHVCTEQVKTTPALKCVSTVANSPPQNLEFQPAYSLAPPSCGVCGSTQGMGLFCQVTKYPSLNRESMRATTWGDDSHRVS
jgi:hypothetical protein